MGSKVDESKIKNMFNIPTTLTEERIAYISRQTGLPVHTVKRVIDTQNEYVAKCIKKGCRVNVVGLAIFEMNPKGHITAKASQRLYNNVEALRDDVDETKVNLVTKQLTYLD